ncbi:hypothetical protein AVEN_193123-1 [Araneus ventricosus]|uniref:Tc1-like transposase DDE domain-containing protein n=1 Tax=Araneus ventricosus TaxID=182803 RepID=A0A4Y2B0Q8_ARAVE|nr:hypothetical protein AVEN_193123-1 [Araneus ventricosus]
MSFMQAFAGGVGVFQRDLAPCHISNLVKKNFKKKKLTVLDWPGNSPDVNPIENLRSIGNRRVKISSDIPSHQLSNELSQLAPNDQTSHTKRKTISKASF